MITQLRRAAAAAALGLTITAAATPVSADDGLKAILVLDASGSMWGQVDGRAKIEVARDTVAELLDRWRDGDALGLVAYGHRTKGDCNDIEVLAAPGPLDRAVLQGAVSGLVPKGKTPMTAAVRQAAEALRYTEGPATVILVSDGEETCGLDPCAVAEELERLGVGLTVHTVGFDLRSDTARGQLACLAEKTGGRYVDAANAADLATALGETVAAAQAPAAEPAEPAPVPEPVAADSRPLIAGVARLSPGGPPLTEGVTWRIFAADAEGRAAGDALDMRYGETRFEISPGRYVLRAELPHVGVDVPVVVEEGKTAEVEAILNAGTVIARAYRSEGQTEPEQTVAWRFGAPSTDDFWSSYDSELVAVVPAGATRITAAVGEASASATVDVAAGETEERDLVVAAGTVRAKALFAAGGPPVTKNIQFHLMRGSGDAEESVTTSYDPEANFLVPPGDYRLRVRVGEAQTEVPAVVEPGRTTELTVVIDAGLLAVSGAGFARIDVVGAEADIYGDRPSVYSSYDPAFQVELPAGDYVVVGRREDDSTAEAPASVVAGNRIEAKLP